MPKYILQKEIPVAYGWTIGGNEEFEADDDEQAKQRVAEIISQQRLYFAEDRIRITRIVFEGYPTTELGYEIHAPEMYEKLREIQLAAEVETFLYFQEEDDPSA